MKTLAELQSIKDKLKEQIFISENSDKMRVVVGMATCGIAAGATPVLEAIVEGVKEAGLSEKVAVTQTGCIGICQFEPVVEIYEAGKRVTYVKMTAEKAKEVIEKHIKGGNVVAEYTIK